MHNSIFYGDFLGRKLITSQGFVDVSELFRKRYFRARKYWKLPK